MGYLTNNAEWDAFLAEAMPRFLAYLQEKATNVGEISTATSLDGITALPARYSLGGVEKTVLAPLTLLTAGVDEAITNANTAATNANAAAANADTSAEGADAAASTATAAARSVDDAKAKALNAATNATAATTSANTAATRLNTLCDNRDKVVEGYWWHYNESTKTYENTGEIAKGNVMYATFSVTDEARLVMTTDEEYTGANFALNEHGILTVTL